ncbi:MAG TPA: FAD-dependent thymidylate synthase [Candidatus Bathyarchaeia archaeon]|nr:FAD-dependent thymidylate synthase [Candidatus Bathyarchaeia archaeon]
MQVKLLTYTGKPELVCAKAMRACRTKQPASELELSSEDVARLIRSARKLEHFSVLEHASFTFSISGISRVCSHQLVRHRMASYSQQSHRTVAMTRSDIVVPPLIHENPQSLTIFKECVNTAFKAFDELGRLGAKLEDARYVLPNALKTNMTLSMNARELIHFFKLRLAASAQWEIRVLAQKMLQEVRKVAPRMFENIEPKS